MQCRLCWSPALTQRSNRAADCAVGTPRHIALPRGLGRYRSKVEWRQQVEHHHVPLVQTPYLHFTRSKVQSRIPVSATARGTSIVCSPALAVRTRLTRSHSCLLFTPRGRRAVVDPTTTPGSGLADPKSRHSATEPIGGSAPKLVVYARRSDPNSGSLLEIAMAK